MNLKIVLIYFFTNFFILWGVDTILGIDIDWLWTFSVDFTFDICLIYTKFFYGKMWKTFLIYFKVDNTMAIQRGIAVCVMGCPKNISTCLEDLSNFQILI